uniref:Uncharacterized protein n=1 Tax=Dulem virus 40 TaxID=3145758 RepID=A0AAU8AUW1_9CAUD
MTERERIQLRLGARRRELGDHMKGRVAVTPKAAQLLQKIAQDEEELKRIDREEADRLALQNAPVDEVLQVIMIPLLADVMNDVAAGVNGMLRRRGCTETVFAEYTADLQRTALKIVDTLAASEAGMPRLLDVDDTLVDAVKKKLMSFIRQRLNITK